MYIHRMLIEIFWIHSLKIKDEVRIKMTYQTFDEYNINISYLPLISNIISYHELQSWKE